MRGGGDVARRCSNGSSSSGGSEPRSGTGSIQACAAACERTHRVREKKAATRGTRITTSSCSR